ncbi:MBL fold metallo-hydrolase [Candidatus Kaiserbacteria bacterium]|nr:MBL fold metallo-hydrolase [Candidatus Kaiserbacteria bacterium]
MPLWIRTRLLFLILFLSVNISLIILTYAPAESAEQNLVVRFLDVGQGDSIHVVTPDGFEVLVDGGATASVLRKLSQGRSFFDRKIDMVVATHPDSDHIAGLVDVMKRYEVEYIFRTNNINVTPASVAFDDYAEKEKAKVVMVQAGQVVRVGASTTIEFFAPEGDTANWPSNNSSIVLCVTYGDIDFLLTGDAPKAVEENIVRLYGDRLESEVLKLGHHGSDTSSSQTFLDVVKPEVAVVSAGKENRYGHPHPKVLERILGSGIDVVSTAESGTITFVTDGSRVWRE